MLQTMSLFETECSAPAVARAATRRHFYRCVDCLSVGATETKLDEVSDDRFGRIPHAVCDACGGRLEYMGATAGVTLQRLVGYQCACDARCTNAMGPSCDCSCGGENHGSGAVVPIYSHGPIPTLGIPKRAAAKAEYYRQLCDELKTKWAAAFGFLAGMRERGDWLDASQFARLNRGRRIWHEFGHCRAMRNYSARNLAISKLIAEIEAR